MKLRNWLIIVAATLSACAQNNSLVVVEVTAMPPLDGIATLRGTASLAGKTAMFDVPIGNAPISLPPARTFGVQVPLALSGTMHVHIEASTSDGTLIASSDGDVPIKPGKRADLPLSLGAGMPGSNDMATNCQPGCSDATPICDNGSATCHACTASAECATQFAATPVCASSGRCVECVTNSDCVAVKKTCDVSQNACVACTKNDDCTSRLCESGACADPTLLVYVNAGGASCPSGPGQGTVADPFCKIQAGMDRGAAIKKRVLVFSGTYGENLVAQPNGGPYAVTLLGFGTPVVSPVVAGAVLKALSDGTTPVSVSLDGFQLQNAKTSEPHGLYCLGAAADASLTKLTVTNSSILGNAGDGINAQNCTVTATSNQITGNIGVGINLNGSIANATKNRLANSSTNVFASGGSLTLDQNQLIGPGDGLYIAAGAYFVTNNFIVDSGHLGVQLNSSGTFAFNTVARNGVVAGGQAWGVGCPSGPNSTVIESSIVWGNGVAASMNTQFSGNCVLINVVAGTTETNAMAIKKDPSFIAIDSMTPHDYHLKANDAANSGATGCCVDVVKMTLDGGIAKLPDHDVDGTGRPKGAGWDVGAHEVQ